MTSPSVARLRGDAVQRGVIINTTWLWARFKPIVEESRRRYSGRDGYSGFEYLATEMMKVKFRKDRSYRIPGTFAKYIPEK